MARGKNPQQTVDKILVAALRLFLERGFERTSIQDIADSLDGLTKGAVYHHFRSKEDILLAVFNRASEPTYARLREIRDNPTLTGAQKLQAVFDASVPSPQLGIWAKVSTGADVAENARLLALTYQNIFAEASPCFVQPIIEQGMRDGTIDTAYPRELAETLLILANLWISPLFCRQTEEELARKISFYLHLARALGVQLEDRGAFDILRSQAGSHAAAP